MTQQGKGRRTYDATRRRAAAERTRLAILDAARELFTESGYVATSVQAVAQRAGVSIDTVYAAVGRKPKLLLAVHDMILAEGSAPLPAEQRDYVRAVRAAPDAVAMIRVYAEAMGRLIPATTPILNALRTAGTTDAECREQYRAISERRAANMRLLAADLRSTGELRDDLTDELVADLIWSLNSPDWYALISSRGHEGAAYGELLADILCRTLLARPRG